VGQTPGFQQLASLTRRKRFQCLEVYSECTGNHYTVDDVAAVADILHTIVVNVKLGSVQAVRRTRLRIACRRRLSDPRFGPRRMDSSPTGCIEFTRRTDSRAFERRRIRIVRVHIIDKVRTTGHWSNIYSSYPHFGPTQTVPWMLSIRVSREERVHLISKGTSPCTLHRGDRHWRVESSTGRAGFATSLRGGIAIATKLGQWKECRPLCYCCCRH
jgi:hypothetical protein